MRELTFQEIDSIAGGLDCFSGEHFMKVQRKAESDGAKTAIVGGIATAIAAFVFTSNPLIAAGATLFIAPYAAIAGYEYSSAWNWLPQDQFVVGVK